MDEAAPLHSEGSLTLSETTMWPTRRKSELVKVKVLPFKWADAKLYPNKSWSHFKILYVAFLIIYAQSYGGFNSHLSNILENSMKVSDFILRGLNIPSMGLTAKFHIPLW